MQQNTPIRFKFRCGVPLHPDRTPLGMHYPVFVVPCRKSAGRLQDRGGHTVQVIGMDHGKHPGSLPDGILGQHPVKRLQSAADVGHAKDSVRAQLKLENNSRKIPGNSGQPLLQFDPLQLGLILFPVKLTALLPPDKPDTRTGAEQHGARQKHRYPEPFPQRRIHFLNIDASHQFPWRIGNLA